MKRIGYCILMLIFTLTYSPVGMSQQTKRKRTRNKPRTLAPRVGATPACRTISVITVGLISDQKVLSKPAPKYPEEAKAKNISGVVRVLVTIDESGKVISARALSGPALLQGAAVEAAYQARFTVTELSGQPLKLSGEIEYNFAQQD